jgi:TRAP-type transport system periplasmic protein
MKTKIYRIAIIAAIALGIAWVLGMEPPVCAMDPVSIDMGTLAPTGGSFYNALMEMSQKWSAVSGGKVKLTIHPDGRQGGEADMVRYMRGGVLNAGLFTAVGLSEIDTSVGGLSFIPMTFRTWEEYDYVRDKLSPRLEKLLLNKGFVILFWGDAGWIRFFSKTPAITPDDFKKFKMFTWAGNSDQVDLMKALGYHPIPLETKDILFSLRTDLINAIPIPPNQASLGQVYTAAPNMLALKWAVLSGAAVIRKDVWDKIPPDVQIQLRSAATIAGEKIRASGRKEDEGFITAMQKKGLKVNPVTPQIEASWQQLTKILYPQLRGKTVPADIFDEVLRLVKEYRDKGTVK